MATLYEQKELYKLRQKSKTLRRRNIFHRVTKTFLDWPQSMRILVLTVQLKFGIVNMVSRPSCSNWETRFKNQKIKIIFCLVILSKDVHFLTLLLTLNTWFEKRVLQKKEKLYQKPWEISHQKQSFNKLLTNYLTF